jgi:hypothetical protein
VAPTTAANATPALILAGLGKALTVGGFTVTPEKEAVLTAEGAEKPKAGDQYLAITVSVLNAGHDTALSLEPSMFSLMSLGSSVSIPLVTLKSRSDLLTAQSLKPGEATTGVLVYEVPQKSQGLQLVFTEKGSTGRWAIGV